MLKIVLTGPESSGKTLLAEALAGQLGTLWVPEFARYYVAHLGRPYEQTDLEIIYRGQRLWENWFLEKARASSPLPCLICDTDWTVIRIWEKYGYRTPSVLPLASDWEQAADTFYLLCAPDFPWQPDPLREHPEERWKLFELYRALLEERKLGYFILEGSHENRLRLATELIARRFGR